MRTSLSSLAIAATIPSPEFNVAQPPTLDRSEATAEHTHVVTSFRFTLAAAIDQVTPLFAPEAERRWAGEHWNPVFLYPQPGRDVPGAVWTIKRGPLTTVWINTLFDVAGGRMQYVAVLPEHFAATVNVQVIAIAPARCAVEVTYARTALEASANESVRALGESDRASAPEWQRGIESALGLPHQAV